MERKNQLPLKSRQYNLKKPFKLAMRSLLTACSKEELCKAFPTFTGAEQESLHRLFIQVIASLHSDIEEEFESLCVETLVETTLDVIDQLVEEQNLDVLRTEKTSVRDVMQDLSAAKESEIQYLTGMLQKAEEQKRKTAARIELLKKDKHNNLGTTNALHKLRGEMLKYEK